MIVRMKKLTLLLYHAEKERFLRRLQELGVVHVVEKEAVLSTELADCAASIKEAGRILALCRKSNASAAGGHVETRAVLSAEQMIKRFLDLEQQRADATQKLQKRQKQEDALLPWGEFDPSLLIRLKDAGVSIRLFRATRRKFESIARTQPAVQEINRSGSDVYFMVVSRGETASLDAEEFPAPEQSLSALKATVDSEKRRLQAIEEEMHRLAGNKEVLKRWISEQTDLFEYRAAHGSLEGAAAGKALVLNGYFPAGNTARLQAFLETYTAWFLVEDPGRHDDVPVLLKNGPFSRMFEPVLKLLSLPNYREIDPVPFFAPFLTLFISLCLGDVGYGSLLLIAGIVGYYKAKPSIRFVFTMIMIIAGFTMAAGVLLNSFFGSTLFGGPSAKNSLVSWGADIFSPLSPIEGPIGIVYPMMGFAMVLGILQVFLAVTLRVINTFRNNGPAAALFPLSFIPLFFGFLNVAAHRHFFNLEWSEFTVGKFMVGKLFIILPVQAGLIMIVTGLVLFLFFNNPKTAFYWRPLRGLWELFNFCTAMLQSILSYLRLFAIGLATSLLGSSFTFMALMLIRREDDSLNWVSPLAIVTLIILVFGHALNLALSIVSSIIHPLRLTFVEFLFSNLGFKGGARQYKPLSFIGKNHKEVMQ